ncbi:MAG: pentapeptide repeat-containing protein [Rhodobacteraceae bacterium]|nr:pentapeptide repeat-containing protein [Paracoccaceae bacterium]
MKRLLTGLALAVFLGPTPSMAADAADVAMLWKTRSCVSCDLSGLDLRKVELNGANLSKANLSGANLDSRS